VIPTKDEGIELYVRNKHKKNVRFTGDKILLYVHGASYCAETTFDLRLGNVSMMELLAQSGYDVYLVDMRGYGRSSRPAEMNAPPDQNPPIVRTKTAVEDLGEVIKFILKHRGVEKINLMGWSWGTSIMGCYTAANNSKVNRLVLYAPQWFRHTPSLADKGGKLGAYREILREMAKDRWLSQVPEQKKLELIPKGWFDKFARATFQNPKIQVPNGVLQDSREFWSSGRALYDPAKIRVPTLLVHAEWDQDLPSYMMHAYYKELKNAPYKRYLEIREGTHSVMMEKNRMKLFLAVRRFLDLKET